MYNGIIIVYKEAGFTSFDVIAKLRGILHQKQIGHTGTLDPDATGVLPVCLGNATKLCDILTEKSKEYEAEMILGCTTDTLDMSGKILEEKEVNITKEDIEKIIMSFKKTYDQVPPMYSALKINGKKLCDLARAGIEVERKPRSVTISKIEILDISLPKVTFRVQCSKGTYIRSLCDDIGHIAGCGAVMSKLTRTRVSVFEMKDALTLSQIEELRDQNILAERIHPVDSVFTIYPSIQILPEAERFLMNGNELQKVDVAEDCTAIFDRAGEFVRVYNQEQKFIALYVVLAGERLKPVKMFFEK